MRLRSDDTVLVIKGRDRGKQGRIQQVYPAKGRVLVDGVNIVSRHTRAATGVRQGGIIQKELPIQAANVCQMADLYPSLHEDNQRLPLLFRCHHEYRPAAPVQKVFQNQYLLCT